MALIAVTAAKGSPGASTAAFALASAWPRRALVAECDPAGSDIAPGWLRGAADVEGRGLLALALAARRGGDHLWQNVLRLDDAGSRLWLPGLADPGQAAAVASQWEAVAAALTTECPDGPVDVLADLGRLGSSHFGGRLLDHADLVLVVLRPTLRGAFVTRPWLTRLRHEQRNVRLLLVGEGTPYSTGEVSKAIAVDAIGVLANDQATAAWLTGEGPKPRRSPLLTSAQRVAEHVAGSLPAGSPLTLAGASA